MNSEYNQYYNINSKRFVFVEHCQLYQNLRELILATLSHPSLRKLSFSSYIIPYTYQKD